MTMFVLIQVMKSDKLKNLLPGSQFEVLQG
jgi:hypothetical protein